MVGVWGTAHSSANPCNSICFRFWDETWFVILLELFFAYSALYGLWFWHLKPAQTFKLRLESWAETDQHYLEVNPLEKHSKRCFSFTHNLVEFMDLLSQDFHVLLGSFSANIWFKASRLNFSSVPHQQRSGGESGSLRWPFLFALQQVSP